MRPATDPASDLARRYGELQARYRGIIDRLPAVLYIDGVNEGDTMVDVGPGIVELLGMTREEWLATSEGWRDVLHPDDLARIVEASERTVETGEPFREQYRAIHRDGHEVWIREEAIRVNDGDGNPQFWLGLMLDVTDTVRTERELQEAQTKYGVLVEQIPAIVYVDVVDETHDHDLRQPADRGVARDHAAGVHRRPGPVDDAPASGRPGRDARHVPRGRESAGEPFTFEYRLIARDGRASGSATAPWWSTTPPGEPRSSQGVMLDITDRKEAEEQAAFLAYHDKLTGLPNRRCSRSCSSCPSHERGDTTWRVCVISLDIDDFKLVNDSLGHEARQRADRASSPSACGRRHARPTCRASRGDEFLLLLADLERTSAVAGRRSRAVRRRIGRGHASRTRCACRSTSRAPRSTSRRQLGIAVFPNHGETADELI